MTSEDVVRKDTTRYLPNLWHSLVQVIIQSRLGEKAYSVAKSPAKGSKMFNMEINIDEEVTHSIKKYMSNQVLSQDNPFSIEILLQTKDGDTMVLEVWTLSMEEYSDVPAQKMCHVTDRMSVLLKSAICVSRITPAYGLSFRQSCDTFVILYRLYTGPPNFSCLGENAAKVKVGQANIQSVHLSVHLSYRTVLTFSSQPKTTPHDQMMLKSDHFKADSSPKHRRINDRVTYSSDTAPTSDESQDAVKLPFNSVMDLHSNSPRSRTSSESSNRGRHSNHSLERLFIPFANAVRPNSLEEFSIPDDIPFSHLLLSTTAEQTENTDDEKKEKERAISESEPETKFTKEVKPPEKPQMTSSDHSNKSFASNATREENEFVLIELKTPFASTRDTEGELTSFYKEWQCAPPLKMFTEDLLEEALDEDSNQLNEQIKSYENYADEYEALVKSLHIEDMGSSQELS